MTVNSNDHPARYLTPGDEGRNENAGKDNFATCMRALPEDIAHKIAVHGGGRTNAAEWMLPDEGRSFRISLENPGVMYLKLEWLMRRQEDFDNMQYFLSLEFIHRAMLL
ncbi:unnamed protein product [Calypogeia fissa]